MEKIDTDDGRPQIVVTYEYIDPTTGKRVFVSRAVDKEDYDKDPTLLTDEEQRMADEFRATMKENGL